MKNQVFKILLVFLFVFGINFSAISQDYCLGDNFTLQATNYVSGTVQWQYSYNNSDWYDFPSANSLTYYFVPEESMFVRLKIIDPQCLSEYYTEKQYLYLIPQPTTANAGEDQLEIMASSITLSANQAEIGTGYWTIMSGNGGQISNPNIPNAVFSGTPGEIYTLRWRIYNACGISDDLIKISFSEGFTCGQNFVDNRDGQIYPTVEIGGKCWFAKNMNIGTMVNSSQDQTSTGNIQKYCYANNTEKCNVFGGLYQWNMAMQFSENEDSQGICPAGWHIPSDQDFKNLELALGMPSGEVNLMNTFRGYNQNVGQQMKQNGGSGFESLMGGARNGGGAFMYGQGTGSYEFAYYWTSNHCAEASECSGYNGNEMYAIRRCLQNGNAGSGRYDTFYKSYGFSVRCVKDN
jgi:uncharacterized protein (TIGR02145 family)